MLLLLLLLNSDGQTVAGRATGYLLAGVLLADLALRGRIDIALPGEPVETGRVLVRGTMPTGDALLDTALERVRHHHGAEPSTVIGPLSRGTRNAALERLTATGIVRVSSRNVLGLFPVRSWPLVHPWQLARVRLAVQATVEHGSSPDTETAMLISLLMAGDVLHQVQPTTDRRAQTLRVQQLVQDNWVALATRKALQDRGAVVAGLVDLPGFIGS
jgi:hypothetical protein